jgi:cyclophilin family peptidyl-prolyl cis-trans isomerase/HEAT repeat protein
MNRNLLLTPAALLFCFAIAHSQSNFPFTLFELQDARKADNGLLSQFSSSINPDERAQTAVAYANIQDSSTVPIISKLLDDRNPAVRSSAAFALGQIESIRSADLLYDRLTKEKEIPVLDALLDAFGKCGTKNDLLRFIRFFPAISEKSHSAAGYCLARFAIRGIKDTTSFFVLDVLLLEKDSKEAAVYAIVRMNLGPVVRRFLPILQENLKEPSPQLRIWSTAALTAVNDKTIEGVLIRQIQKDTDWRVRVTAIRSLRSFYNREVDSALCTLSMEKDEHAALTSLTILSSDVKKRDSLLLDSVSRSILEGGIRFSWRRKGEAAKLRSILGRERSFEYLATIYSKTQEGRFKIIEAIGETKSAKAIPLFKLAFASVQSNDVISAIEAYKKIAGIDTALQRGYVDDVLPLLERNDAGISATVISSLRDTTIYQEGKTRAILSCIRFLDTANLALQYEAVLEAVQMLGETGGEKAIPVLEKVLRTEISLRTLASKAIEAIQKKPYNITQFPVPPKPVLSKEDRTLLRKIHGATIHTLKGDIRISFVPHAAPFTVLNFIRLAGKKFYNGLQFHRVVPNFVIQGGDPLGNGFGGPGYLIRTEVYPDFTFTEGAVGMASAGKDTEGSQFFITHCATPHLDGHYTVFGYTSDLDIVSAIQMGDKIISIDLLQK